MSYILHYGAPIKQEQRTYNNRRRSYILCGTILAAAIVLTAVFPGVADAIKSILIPGDDAVTVEAFRLFLSEMDAGAPLSECITVFCEEVLYGLP